MQSRSDIALIAAQVSNEVGANVRCGKNQKQQQATHETIVAAGYALQPDLLYAPPMEPQQPPTIQITLDEQVAQGEYVNFANIIHSPSEFVIDLGRMMPGRTDVKVYSRVIMTPLHAKQLLEALAQNINLFEQKFGEIRLDAAAGYSANEPSN